MIKTITMKNILIVTDFSPASHNAALYGMEMARAFGAKVYLFHAYITPVQVPESYLFYTPEDVWNNIREMLEKEAGELNPGKDVTIEICGAEGKPATAILHEAKSRNIDLIVCGMKGSAKGLRKIFGSTATALTATSEIPLLILPEGATFRKPERIALASDMDTETSPLTISLLKAVSEKFHSKVSVVWVVENEVDEAYKLKFRPTNLISDLKKMDTEFEFPKGTSVSGALETFATEHTIDMMAMIPHKHNLLERFFVESTTNKMIFHTHIPLLILPQKKMSEAETVKNENRLTEMN